MEHIGTVRSSEGLKTLGLDGVARAFWNLGTARLYEEAVRRGEGRIAAEGPLVVQTGAHTGRSAKDKFVVRDSLTEANVWWGSVNQPMSSAHFGRLEADIKGHLAGQDVFVQDLHAGADARHRLNVQVITTFAWQSLFIRHLLIEPTDAERAQFRPGFTIIDAPSFRAVPARHGCHGETVIAIDFARRLVLIGGTSYAGEIKKSLFTILNYLLPEAGVLPMHCSVNVGTAGDSAVFFGLSGTGKTTLSADASRTLVGDDEHGWSERGVFNFEGGCYAKVIRLDPKAEPEIHATTRRFGTVLENVVMDPATGALDLDDARLSENTRGAYPLSFIPNASTTGIAGYPRNVIMLTADAFGVLPPIARLTPEQTIYHFLSGYTAKVAGTEKGLGKEPEATFSTCFGAPFMPRHPAVYARMLADRVGRADVDCWLVNTGWSGGAFGVGKRMAIAHTRALLRQALDGGLRKGSFRRDTNFGVLVPERCAGVPDGVLNPRATWADGAAYDSAAQALVARFQRNFEQFAAHVADDVRAAGPHIAA
ncbi:MAG: phosphoenolpyruvate carboxykinase [Alphaproteobacteria bacterium]|nr:phosphoenolpyruvate carboxykinase [Alphaproteobacteria bacterium]